MSSCILQLEDPKMSIVQSLSLVRNLQSDLDKSAGDGVTTARNKLTLVLSKNVRFAQIGDIGAIIGGTSDISTLLGGDENFSSADIEAYTYAPARAMWSVHSLATGRCWPIIAEASRLRTC